MNFKKKENMQNITRHNKSVFNKSCMALRKGIENIYYRDSENKTQILEIYDTFIYVYMDKIYDIVIKHIRLNCSDFSKKIMYNNMINLIVLFFWLDYLKIDTNESNILSKVDEFVGLLVNEGMKFNKGNEYFILLIDGFLTIMDLNNEYFPILKLLDNPKLSIFYDKNNNFNSPYPSPRNRKVSSPETCSTSESNSSYSPSPTFDLEHIETQEVLASPVNLLEINLENRQPIINPHMHYQSKIEEIMKENETLKEDMMKMKQFLQASIEQNAYLTSINTLLIQQKEIILQEYEKLSQMNGFLTKENEKMVNQQKQQKENEVMNQFYQKVSSMEDREFHNHIGNSILKLTDF